MKIEVLPNADAVAKAAAARVAAEARAAGEARGRFTLAVSGGRTPWQMLRELAEEDMPWPLIEIFQVDERVAPFGDVDRNLSHLHESLLAHSPLRMDQIHAMPVEMANLDAASADYAKTLQRVAGSPAVIDLVHLGLGPDGHTASLVPGDPVLDETESDVAMTASYRGRRRMTLTYPVLNRARRILWLVTGSDKCKALGRLQAADPSIPAGRVAQEHALVLADAAAAHFLGGV
jgi:6-phosphogluconolactonase